MRHECVWAILPVAADQWFEELVRIRASSRDAKYDERPAVIHSFEQDEAVVRIDGVIVGGRRDNLLYSWGLSHTGTEDIADALDAVARSGAKTVRLEIDSPGGTAVGLGALADRVAALRATRPVHTVAKRMMASAAFFIGSQASSISVGRDAVVGAIGTYAVVVDSSKLASDAGIKVHVLRSSPGKGVGVFGAPVSEEQLSSEQALVDDLGAQFVAAVAAGRGVDVETARAWATGHAYTGAVAYEIGLVDSLLTVRNAAPAAPTKKEKRMEAASVAEMRAAFPDDPGFVLDQMEKGASLLEARASYADVLRSRLAEERASRAAEAAAGPVVTGVAFTAVPEPAAKDAWETDAALRAEFMDDRKVYDAYRRAAADGTVRILRGRVEA